MPTSNQSIDYIVHKKVMRSHDVQSNPIAMPMNNAYGLTKSPDYKAFSLKDLVVFG